jgi:predicted dithiol-disulfide oxidoreductase (DUF899 family)
MEKHSIVSREEWLKARTALLALEKEMTRLRDALATERRRLPWVRIDKDYVFDGPSGWVSLSDLFDGRSQFFIKHVGAGRHAPVRGLFTPCGHVEGLLEHLNNRDVTYAVVARAPIDEIEVVRQRMGWRFPWVSSYHSDFNYDFNVSFTDEEMTAHRAFYNFRWIDPDLSGDSAFCWLRASSASRSKLRAWGGSGLL